MSHRAAPLFILAALHAAAARGAPAAGEGYIVEGRCVTLTQADGDKVSYEWREGNAYGSGYGPPDILGARCRAGAPAKTTSPAPARPPAARPPGNAPAAPTSAPPAGGFAQEALQAHNRLRCMHGVPALQWSPDVAAYAQRWVDSHPFGHSDSYEAAVGPLGENIAGGYDTLTAAAGDWYGESKGYDYRRAGYQNGTGHFTAMIWKGVRYVGCGRKGDFISCNYFAGPDPAPCAIPNFNMDRCSLSQVLPPTRSANACP